MNYAEKITAMRRAIGAVIVTTMPDMELSEKIDVLEMMYEELRGFESMLPYEQPSMSPAEQDNSNEHA